jgi:peptidoglycan/LPS O-acetylase OafA/YrhL
MYKEKVKIPNEGVVIGLFLLFWLMHGSEYERYFFYLAIFATVLYFAMNSMVLKLRLKLDVSYGVFLWGFPIQQTLIYMFPSMGRAENCLVAMVLAMIMGYFSWVIVERRSIQLGKKITFGLKKYRLYLP